MRTLRSLLENNSQVWIFCRDENLQIAFLEQADKEGFIALNGEKPVNLFHHRLYGLNPDMTMGYLSSMIWAKTLKINPDKDDIIRIDYEKFLAGIPDYRYYG